MKESSPTPGVIRDGETYTLPEFRSRLGIGDHAWRSMRNQGLPVYRVCNRVLIRGDEFWAWLASREAD